MQSQKFTTLLVCACSLLGGATVTVAAAAVPAQDKSDGDAAAGLSMTLTDGDTQFVLNGIEGQRLNASGGMGDLFTGVGDDDIDHLFQSWFWYRTSDDSREYALSNRVSGGGGGGNSDRLVYIEPADDGNIPNALLVELEYTLTDLSTTAADQVLLQVGFRLTNLTSSNLNVQFFAYNDIELSESVSNDTAIIGGSDFHRQTITDPETGDRAEFVVSGSNQINWQIATFSTIRNELTDSGVDNLTDAGSPFGPADYTGAHQWGTTLAGSGQPVQSTLVGSMVIHIHRPTCASDIAPAGGDGQVNTEDLLRVLADWGLCQ